MRFIPEDEMPTFEECSELAGLWFRNTGLADIVAKLQLTGAEVRFQIEHEKRKA